MTWLDNIIKEAGKGSEETDEEMPKNETLSKELTAEEQAAAKNILDMLSSKQKYDEDLIRKDEARIFESDVPVDINGHENHTNEAVFYQPSTSYTKHVPGVPYAVSDVNWMCNQCTEHKICERHLHDRKPQKTDVSLCSDSHLRMAVYWDISDPENRKKTWRFVIEEKYDRFRDPEQVRSKHDFAANRGGGCKPYEPVHRIKELASRIVQDYNEDQKDKVRVANLDSKGREYYTKPKHWGGKEPFKPSEAAHVRAAHEYDPSGGSRIEAELCVLLQAWYQSKLPQSEHGIDRTTANANKIWRKKMELQAVDKVAQLAGGKSGFKEKMATLLLGAMKTNANEMKRFEMNSRAVRDTTMKTGVERAAWCAERLRAEKAAKSKARYAKKEETRRAAFVDSVDSSSEKAEEVTDDTLAMFEQMAKDVEDEDKGGKQKPKQVDPITKPKVSKAPREPTAEERELLQKIQDAGEEDAQEEESVDPEPEAEIEEEKEEEEDAKTETPKSSMPEPKSNKRKATTSISPSAPSAKKSKKDPKPTVTPKPKRKATTPASSEPSAKKSRKSYKSADIIDDSNDEADYDLPSAPALALSEQREGWKIPGVVGEGIHVVQTDRKEGSVKASKADSEEVSVDVVVERGTTIVREVVRRDTPVRTPSPEPKFPRTATSPAPSHTSSGQSASSASSKKRKTVSWSDDLVEQPEKKRKFSQFYAPSVGQAYDDDLFDE